MIPEQPRILILEDEPDIQDLLSGLIQELGFQTDAFGTTQSAREAAEKSNYDLFVLDWMLPDGNGIDLVQWLRSDTRSKRAPILMVTARIDAESIVMGLEAGADDYVTKPFDSNVLLARVKALMRRNASQSTRDANRVAEIVLGGLTIRPDTHEAICCSEKLNLTLYEFKLLLALVENQGRILTREKILEMVVGTGVKVIDRAVDNHIFWLRKKMGECSNLVETVRGVGYRITTASN